MELSCALVLRYPLMCKYFSHLSWTQKLDFTRLDWVLKSMQLICLAEGTIKIFYDTCAEIFCRQLELNNFFEHEA